MPSASSPSCIPVADKSGLSLKPTAYDSHLLAVVDPQHTGELLLQVNSFSFLNPFPPFLFSYLSSPSFPPFLAPFPPFFNLIPFFHHDSSLSFPTLLPSFAFLAPFPPILSSFNSTISFPSFLSYLPFFLSLPSSLSSFPFSLPFPSTFSYLLSIPRSFPFLLS